MDAPKFTGRNVPIEEIAAFSGLTPETIMDGIKDGTFGFGYFIRGENFSFGDLLSGGKENCIFYCPDKKVWEETGYFNDKFADGE